MDPLMFSSHCVYLLLAGVKCMMSGGSQRQQTVSTTFVCACAQLHLASLQFSAPAFVPCSSKVSYCN